MDKAKIIATLIGKPLITGVLWDEGRDCGCAVGQLLVTAGVPKKHLYNAAGTTEAQRIILQREYGMEDWQTARLMNLNDGITRKSRLDRSARVISKIRTHDFTLWS